MIGEDPPIHTCEELEAAISRVSFERSCLDMGWKWEAKPVRDDVYGETYGWLIPCSFRRPDRDTGEIGTGWGRWLFIEEGATVSAVVKSMYAAAKLIVEHELLEAFKFDGERPFDPHRTVQELVKR